MRLGIIGTGRIANRFIDEISYWHDNGSETKIMDIEVSCVYNPHIDSAKRFAEAKQIPEYTDNPLVFADKCDAVYIASPHSTHEEYVKRMLMAGKHVLCEKPLSFSRSKAIELYGIAKERNLILMEAVKTLHCPGFLDLAGIVRDGRIGKIRDVEACFTKLTLSNTREYEDSVYGGSFTELGTYAMLPALCFLGTEYKDVTFSSVKAENGVDVYTRASFDYGDRFATAKTGLAVKSEGELIISGEKGYIVVPAPWWLTKSFDVRYEDPNRVEHFEAPFIGSGLEYETEFFAELVYGRMSGLCDKVLSPDDKDNIAEQRKIRTYERLLEGNIKISVAMADVMGKFLAKRKNERTKQGKEKSNNEILGRKDSADRNGAITRGCSAENATENMKDNTAENVKIWGQRGCCYRYPENTISAFMAAAAIPGITGIETDVQLTKDGEVVVFHDENVKRVTDGDRDVKDYTFAEIEKLKIDARGMGRDKQDDKRSMQGNMASDDKQLLNESESHESGTLVYEHIPSLDEFLTAMEPYCTHNGMLINIELKTSKCRYEGIEEKTLAIVKKHGLERYIVYSSFLADSIELMKKLDPECSTGMLAMTYDDCLYRKDGTPIIADALHPYIGGLVTELPADKKGITVRAWNGEEPFFTNDKRQLSDKDLRESVQFGVTDIITNVPEKYLENNA